MIDLDLPPRNQEILRAVVQTFIETGEPVGSRTLSRKHSISLSPATIRNILSDLAEAGLLVQPHVSAGRLPTDLGYRVFVDLLMENHQVTPQERESIRKSYASRVAQIEFALTQATRILSELTNQAGVIRLPGEDQLQFQHIEFVRMADRKVLVVVIAMSGVVQNRIVHSEEDIGQEELNRISRYLNDEFAGLTLRAVRAKVLEHMGEEKRHLDAMYRRALDLSKQTFLEEEEDEGADSLFMEGTSRVFSQPDFAEDFDKLQNLYKAFEEKGKLVRILDSCLDSRNVSVVIGSESEIESMKDCSVVARTYFMGDRPLGAIGLIGPKRMPYARAVSLVDWTAKALSRFLTGQESR